MSRQNKVNKTNYNQRGRLTADELARERMTQAQVSGRTKHTGKFSEARTGGKVRAGRTQRRTASK